MPRAMPSGSSSSRCWASRWSWAPWPSWSWSGDRLLPLRTPESMPADLSQHARTLVEQYDLEGTAFQLRVRTGSPLVSTDAEHVDLTAYPGIVVVGTQSGSTAAAGATGSSRLATHSWSGATRPPSVTWHPTRASPFARTALLTPSRMRCSVAPLASPRSIIPPRSTLVGTAGLPGHGDTQRRPGDPGGPATRRARRSCRRRSWPLATPCCSRGRGRRSMSTSPGPRSSWSTTRAWSADRPCPWAPEPGRRWHPRGHGRAARDRDRAVGRGRVAGGGRDGAPAGGHACRGRIAPSRGPRSCSWAP